MIQLRTQDWLRCLGILTSYGGEVEAEDAEQYLRKAQVFNQEASKRRGQGRPVDGPTPGAREWKKSVRYIHVAPNGEIVSFEKDHAALVEVEDDKQF